MRAALLLMVMLGGCAGPLVAPESRPPDFSIALTVYPSGAIEPPSGGERFVLEADGVLRAGFGNAAVDHPYPSAARTLSPDEFDRLYIFSRERGLLTPADGARVGGPGAYERDESTVTFVSVSYDGARRHAVYGAEDTAALELREFLRGLAWR
ncbi:MAG: hypothetical protein AAFR38_12575 [Planctomycetota bacterium]